jgi:DNA-binding IscR family transcriptional regulator
MDPFKLLIVLLGAELTYHSEVIPWVKRDDTYKLISDEQLALWLCSRYTRAFMEGNPPLVTSSLARELGTSLQPVRRVVQKLHTAGVIAHVHFQTYLLAKSPELLTIQSVKQALEEHSNQKHPVRIKDSFDFYAEQLVYFDEFIASSSKNLSLKELLEKSR